MLKKMVPFALLAALFLGACTNNNKEVPPVNDNSPMRNIEERDENQAPRMEDKRRDGTDLDGVETEDGRNDGLNNDPNDSIPGTEENLDRNNGR